MNKKVSKTINLLFKGSALAMAVAVVILNILKAASVETSIPLLGSGLFCLAIISFNKQKEETK